LSCHLLASADRDTHLVTAKCGHIADYLYPFEPPRDFSAWIGDVDCGICLDTNIPSGTSLYII
jgi:hypothetical protein